MEGRGLEDKQRDNQRESINEQESNYDKEELRDDDEDLSESLKSKKSRRLTLTFNRPKGRLPNGLVNQSFTTNVTNFTFEDKHLIFNILDTKNEELSEETLKMKERLDNVTLLNQQIIKFNTHFSSFLQSLQFNSYCNDYYEKPNEATFRFQSIRQNTENSEAEAEATSPNVEQVDIEPEGIIKLPTVEEKEKERVIQKEKETEAQEKEKEEEKEKEKESTVKERRQSIKTPILKNSSRKSIRTSINSKKASPLPLNSTTSPNATDRRKTVRSVKIDTLSPRKSIKKRKLPTKPLTYAMRKKRSKLDFEKILSSLPIEYREAPINQHISEILMYLETNDEGATKKQLATHFKYPEVKVHAYLNTLMLKGYISKVVGSDKNIRFFLDAVHLVKIKALTSI